MKRLSMRPNCSRYRGISYQPTSWALGLCLTGVKKEPTVNGNPYRYVNVGSAVIGLPSAGRGQGRPGQLRLKEWPRGGAVGVVGAGERPGHGEAPQSLQPVTTGSREDEDVCPISSKPNVAWPRRRCTNPLIVSTTS